MCYAGLRTHQRMSLSTFIPTSGNQLSLKLLFNNSTKKIKSQDYAFWEAVTYIKRLLIHI